MAQGPSQRTHSISKNTFLDEGLIFLKSLLVAKLLAPSSRDRVFLAQVQQCPGSAQDRVAEQSQKDLKRVT